MSSYLLAHYRKYLTLSQIFNLIRNLQSIQKQHLETFYPSEARTQTPVTSFATLKVVKFYSKRDAQGQVVQLNTMTL